MVGIRDTALKNKSRLPHVSRRQMLVGATAAGGLAIAWSLWPRDYQPNVTAAPDEHVFNAFLKIGDDGHISAIVPQCEMGQGVTTLLPQIMADELGADWRTIAVETAPISPLYTNTLLVDEDSAVFTPRAGVPDFVSDVRSWARREWAVRHAVMLTANSSSVRMFEGPCRAAAAQARALLMMAAAARWDADWEDCDTQDGFVILGKKKLRFGEACRRRGVARTARRTRLSRQQRRPAVRQGTDAARPARQDRRVGQLCRRHPPARHGVRGDPAGTAWRDAAEKHRPQGGAWPSPGLLHVVTHERWVATVARNWWAANRALDRFAPVFETAGTPISTDRIDAALKQALKDGGYRISHKGDVAEAMTGRTRIAAEYAVAPALHAPIETRSATAAPDGGRLRVWVATQAPAQCRDAIAQATGLAASDVILFPMMAGGSFDACLDHSAAVQAAIIALQIKRPVQLAWSRAEEIMRLPPRAPARARLSATLNAAGGIDALVTRIAVPPTNHEVRARLFDNTPADVAQRAAAGSADAAAVEGAASSYTIPHHAVDHCPADIGLPTGRWRGNADSYTAFFTESFVDEMAARAGTDGLSYRIAMLGDAPLLARCLLTATSLGGWEGGLSGTAQGLACHSMRGSHIALMATARQSDKGLQVEQLVAVVDAGRLVNPSVARQQIEGGLIFGLAAAVGATTDYEGGVATARKLGQLGLPRLSQTPQILVEFVDSDREPGGLGEIAVPVVAPAIANAMFAATGRRIRRLPLSAHPL